MIFRKKYKKSEWMEGLLWAEKYLLSGGTVRVNVSFNDSLGNQIVSTDKDGIKVYFYSRTPHFGLGVFDYLNYFEENKEILLKAIDK